MENMLSLYEFLMENKLSLYEFHMKFEIKNDF